LWYFILDIQNELPLYFLPPKEDVSFDKRKLLSGIEYDWKRQWKIKSDI